MGDSILNELLSWLIGVAVIFPILSAIAYFLVLKLIKNKLRLWPVSILLGAVFTFVTLFFLQGHSVLFKQESTVLSKISNLRQLVGLNSKVTSYVNDNFIFVNTALNPQLVPKIDANDDDLAKQVITDRHLLNETLKLLAEHQKNLSLVVCDLIFTDSTGYDSSILGSMKLLQTNNKLLLAYNSYLFNIYPFFFNHLDISSFGDATNVSNEPFYFSHTIVNDENIPSLPYAMYLKTQNIKPVLGSFLLENGGFVFKNFIPEFSFTNDQSLYKPKISNNTSDSIKIAPDTNFKPTHIPTMFSLGTLSDSSGRQDFADLLSLRRTNKNIVFIGNFTDDYLDRHETAYGQLHGSTILLNEFFYIWQGYHRFTMWKLLLYCFSLQLMFTLMFAYIIKEKVFLKEKRFTERHNEKPVMFLLHWLKELFEFIVEEAHYFMLFIIAIIIDVCFHRIVNIMGLLYILLPFSALLRFFANRQKS